MVQPSELPWRPGETQGWSDWRWQMRNVIDSPAALGRVIALTGEERETIESTRDKFAMAIPPYYASLMDPQNPFCPVRMMAVPRASETVVSPGELRDPLGEEGLMAVPNLVHRYPDRVLLLLNNMCPMYCRFCTRKRLTGLDNEVLPRDAEAKILEYLRANPQVRDVLVSGGDPLLVADGRLDKLLGVLREVPSIEVIRIGTRMPVVLPQRITPELTQVLRRHRVWVITHFNHPKELTDAALGAVARLVDAGVPMANQTVLLRRVNSSLRILRDLFQQLAANRVMPYYLHQCDVAEGLEGFRTPVAKGMEIMEGLLGHTSGYVVPRYVVDLPGGGGKVPLWPGYVLAHGEKHIKLRNFEGRIYDYPEPRERDCECPYEAVWYGD